jgi:hypothetical protein
LRATNIMSCCKTYDPCLDGKLNQIGSYASVARQSAQSATASATSAAASAAAAAASAEIAGIYLGPFAVAPTTDNEGGPLQEGMLYYNTVSNGLFVWNGSVWASADFNEFTNFTATGTTTARNLVTRFSEIIQRKDFDTDQNYLIASSQLSTNGFWMDESPEPRHWRFADRVFIGKAASETTGNKLPSSPATGTFLTTQMGAFWMERGATTLSVAPYGEFGGVFATRTSDKSLSGYYGTASIGVVGVVENDDSSANQTIGWAGYFEANRTTNNKVIYGLEVSVKNKGSNVTPSPYNRNGWGSIGIWFPAGGDASYNGVNMNPCSSAMMIGKGDDQGNPLLPMTWNRGIIINSDSITGTDGVSGTGIAIDMAKGHVIQWSTASGQGGGSIYSNVNNHIEKQGIIFENKQIRFTGSTGGINAIIGDNTGSDNNIRIFAEQTGTSPTIQANGIDSDIDLKLSPKGAGKVQFGTRIANADTPITGYIEIKDASGNTRKLALIS